MMVRAQILAAAAMAFASLAPAAGAQTSGSAGISLGDAVESFDWKTHRVILALPPGIDVSGPYAIHLSVSGEGSPPLFEGDLTLIEKELTRLSLPGLPPDERLVRLSAGPAWPAQLADISRAMDEAKAKYPPGKRELEFRFNLNTSIDPKSRDAYCKDNVRIPAPQVFIATGAAAQLQRVDISPVADALTEALKHGCDTPQTTTP